MKTYEALISTSEVGSLRQLGAAAGSHVKRVVDGGVGNGPAPPLGVLQLYACDAELA